LCKRCWDAYEEAVAPILRDREENHPAGRTRRLVEVLAAWERPEWHTRAACRGVGPEEFFPPFQEGRGHANAAQQTYAETTVKYCGNCPVRAECLEAGAGETVGLWGGVGPRKRKARPRDGE
jgi:Transcription factor WhiB